MLSGTNGISWRHCIEGLAKSGGGLHNCGAAESIVRDSLNQAWQLHDFDQGYPATMSAELPLGIDVQTVKAMLDAGTPFCFLDCREPDEHQVAHIEGAELIPMGQLPSRLAELESHRTGRVVVHCHHGGRSTRVANWLRAQGFVNAQTMDGGIDAWAQQIDTKVARY